MLRTSASSSSAQKASHDLSRDAPTLTRLMFAVRWQLGRWFGWDAPADRPIPGRSENSLAERLPPDLRGTVEGLAFGSTFAPVYRTDTEFAAEISNQTVHAVMHLAWIVYPALLRQIERVIAG
jgi:hypothetical protein